MRHPARILALAAALCAPTLPASAAANGGLDALADRLAVEHPEIPSAPLRRLFDFMRTHYVPNSRYAAVIDFDKPSDQKRLYIINLESGEVRRYLVAHGSGSGGRTPEEFSDQPNSHESSLGVYLTGEEYPGGHGRSLKLRGMESSNNMAESRKVVIHGAKYVSDENAQDGSIGRSHGCPAVDFEHLDEIIDALRGGAALIIYAK